MRHPCLVLNLSVMLFLILPVGIQCSERTQAAGSPSAYPIPGDRWLEIDLYWFEQQSIAGSAKVFWDRFQPLFTGVQGYRGLILNVGWTVGCIMECQAISHRGSPCLMARDSNIGSR